MEDKMAIKMFFNYTDSQQHEILKQAFEEDIMKEENELDKKRNDLLNTFITN